MSIENLNQELTEMIKKERMLKQNTKGCRIKVLDDVVQVSIPIDNNGTAKLLNFSKREVRELFEKLYSE